MRLVLLFALLCAPTAVLSIIKVDPNTLQFVDEHGRERFYHGLNVVYKSPPYLPVFDSFDPQLSFSEQDMAYFKQWGLNIIRLGVMWPGAEPVQGQYDAAYLKNARTIIETAAKYNITTLADCHQDCLAEQVRTWTQYRPFTVHLSSPCNIFRVRVCTCCWCACGARLSSTAARVRPAGRSP
jgi:hypothetical protein